jgi:hypothetical protein
MFIRVFVMAEKERFELYIIRLFIRGFEGGDRIVTEKVCFK